MTASEIITAIIAGDADDKFDAIYDAIKTRRDALTRQAVRTITVGSLVRFNDQTRPKYLQGVEGTVLKKNQKSVQVKLAETVGKYHADVPIRVPASLLEVVNG